MTSTAIQKSNSPFHGFYNKSVKIAKKHPYKTAAFSASVLATTGYLALNSSTVSRALKSVSNFFSSPIQTSSGFSSYVTSTNILITEALAFVLLGLVVKYEGSKKP